MVLGMSLETYTTMHVIICLIGIVSGLIVVFGMIANKRLDGMTALFLLTNVLTDITGFLFPFHGFLPSYGVGILSMVLLLVAIVARYTKHLAGGWRRTYVITAVIALYLNCFVLVVQSFEKVPSIHAMAPTQKEPPFAIAQVIVMVLFIVLGIFAAKKFHPYDGRT